MPGFIVKAARICTLTLNRPKCDLTSDEILAAAFSLAKKIQPCVIFVQYESITVEERTQFITEWDKFSTETNNVTVIGMNIALLT